MLNHLIRIAGTLSDQGVLKRPDPKQFTRIKAGKVVVVTIDTKGKPKVSLETNDPKSGAGKVERDKKASWPAVNHGQDEKLALSKKIKDQAALAASYLPKETDLAKDAVSVLTRITPETLAEIDAQFDQLVEEQQAKIAEIESSKKATDEDKARAKTLKGIFAEKAPQKATVLIGTKENKHNLTSNTWAMECAEAMEPAGAASTGKILDSQNPNKPEFKGFPLMIMGYMAASRAGNFPALHNYAEEESVKKGTYLPISSDLQQKLSASLELLCRTPELHRSIKVRGKDALLLVAPISDTKVETAGLLLEMLRPADRRKIAENQTLFRERATAETGEILLLCLESAVPFNIRPLFEKVLPAQVWADIETEWLTRQGIPGYSIGLAAHKGFRPTMLDTEGLTQLAFCAPMRKLAARAEDGARFSVWPLLDEKPHVRHWISLQEILMRNLRLSAVCQARTDLEKVLSIPAADRKNPSGISPRIQLAKCYSLLIAATNAIQTHMSTTPTHQTTGFLLGQLIQQLDKLADAYHKERVEKRASSGGSSRVKRSGMAKLAEYGKIDEAIIQASKAAQPYLQHAEKIARRASNSDYKSTPCEIGVMGAAKIYRNLMHEFSEALEIQPSPKTPAERRHLAALVRIGMDARKVFVPKESTKTDAPNEIEESVTEETAA